MKFGRLSILTSLAIAAAACTARPDLSNPFVSPTFAVKCDHLAPDGSFHFSGVNGRYGAPISFFGNVSANGMTTGVANPPSGLNDQVLSDGVEGCRGEVARNRRNGQRAPLPPFRTGVELAPPRRQKEQRDNIRVCLSIDASDQIRGMGEYRAGDGKPSSWKDFAEACERVIGGAPMPEFKSKPDKPKEKRKTLTLPDGMEEVSVVNPKFVL